MSEQGWIDANVAELPQLTLKHIHQYFITGRLRKERVTATKPFERGYRLFDSKKVQCVSVHDVKQPLIIHPMGKLFTEVVPVLQVVQPVITLLH